MSLIPNVKCGRCDRNYSGLKLRCPYCGAGRSRGGKRANDSGDASARRMIQALLVLVLVITVISAAVLDLNADPVGTPTPGGPGMSQGQGGGAGNGEENEDPTPTPIPTPTPTPTPVPVTSVNITWAYYRPGINEMTIHVGTQIDLWAEIFPTDAVANIEWLTENHLAVGITIDHEDPRRVTIEGRSAGQQSIIRASVGNMNAEVLVRVR